MAIQAVHGFTAAENEVNMLVGNLVVKYMMRHCTEGRYAGSRTYKKQVAVYRRRKHKHALRTPQGQRGSNRYLVEQVGGAQASFQQNDHQLNYIRIIGPGSDGVTSPAFVGLLMDGQVKGYELAGGEIEFFQFRYLYPEPARTGGFIFNAYNGTCSPWLQHKKKFFQVSNKKKEDRIFCDRRYFKTESGTVVPLSSCKAGKQSFC
jgi:hypothetical protein